MNEIADFLFPNAPTGIVACSASDARVWLSTSRFGDWSMIKSMQNPAAALREKDIAADRPGRTFDSFGSGRHAKSPGQTGRERQLLLFATDLARFINESIVAGIFANIVLIAEPRLLGLLRNGLSATASRAVVLETSKNLADLNVDEIRDYFGLPKMTDTRRSK
jgi:protein required for attachment to host cells